MTSEPAVRQAPLPGRFAGLLAGCWLGLAAGLLGAAVRAVEHFAFGKLLLIGDDAWWGYPLLLLVVAGVPSLLVVILTPNSPLGQRIRYTVPATVGALELVMLVPRLAQWAALIVALGVGVRTAALLVRHSVPFHRLVRWTLPAAVTVLLGAGGWQRWLEARTMSPGPAPETLEPPRPNLLLLVLDTVRAIELGLYGFRPSPTPMLDALGSQGVVFDQAIATAPWTAPSHASLFTGRRPHELSIDWTSRLDGAFPTLAEALRDAGYRTGGFVANVEYASSEAGLARGFRHYEDYRHSFSEVLRWSTITRVLSQRWKQLLGEPSGDLPGRLPATENSGRFLRWLDRQAGLPWFGFLNFYDAHAPYFAPEPYWSAWLPGERRRPLSVAPGSWPLSRSGLARQGYTAAVAALDGAVGALLDSLRARRALDNTLVIVLGDHGEEFLEHGLMGHGNSLYSPSVRVPLILWWPGHLAPARILPPASLASVAATAVELLGVKATLPGPSLSAWWSRGPIPAMVQVSAVSRAGGLPDRYPVTQGALAAARLGKYRFITSPFDRNGLLFDEEADPMEQTNLAGEGWAAALLRELRDSATAALPHHRRP